MTSFEEIIFDTVKACGNSEDAHPSLKELSLQANTVQVIKKADGSTSHLHEVKSEGTRILAKSAAKYFKPLGERYPLDPDRLVYEARSLSWRERVCPGSVPQLIGSTQSILFMEYLDGWEVQQEQLISCSVDKVAIQNLAVTLGKIHNATHVDNISADDFSLLEKDLDGNPMKDLIQQFMFIRPFDPNEATNQVKPELQEVARKLQGNQSVLAKVEQLRQLHMNKKECLVHGDLCTAAVMVKEGQAKIIHGGLSHVGPAALDLGLLLSNYMTVYHSHMLTEENNDWHRQVSYKMIDACHNTVNFYLEQMTCHTANRDQYVATLMSEVAGFAGLDMIRRTLGAVRAKEIDGSGSKELEVINSGLRLLQASHRIHDIDRLLNIALMLTF